MDVSVIPIRTPKEQERALVTEPERCKGCGFCVEFCPKDALALSTDCFNAKGYAFAELTQPEQCVGCGTCTLYCPDFAIYLTDPEPDTTDALHDAGQAAI